jgi:hypothetical protein
MFRKLCAIKPEIYGVGGIRAAENQPQIKGFMKSNA